MPTAEPVVGVIHATPLSIGPIVEAFTAEFPAARLRHLLDDSLLGDLRAAGALTGELEERMERLVGHLLTDRPDALQFACSGYVPVVDRVAARETIPVRKPDEAMYRELVASGHADIGIVATVQPALDLASGQLRALLDSAGRQARVRTRCVPEAMDAAQRGDTAELARLVSAGAAELAGQGVGVVALAQYSMSPVADEIAAQAGLEVVTGPRSAARDLCAALPA